MPVRTACLAPVGSFQRLAWRGFSSSEAGGRDLAEQVRVLSDACAGLAKQVQEQNALLLAQRKELDTLASSVEAGRIGNLLEIHAMRNGGKFPNREEFEPTLDMVANQVAHTCHLDNDTLASMAIAGDGFARRERMLREIMHVEKCSWDDAHEKLIDMDKFNEEYYWAQTFPYRIGIIFAVAGCAGSVLMVFYKPVAVTYGNLVAGEDIPEGVDGMTVNQVGTWTWAWMEPMIGVASFVLLCLQFIRAQMVKMRMSPYTGWMLKSRAQRAAKQYPQYQSSMVRTWAVQMPMCRANFFPIWKREMYTKEKRRSNFRLGI